MASSAKQCESDDDMDEFMDKFKTMDYKNAFSKDNWEEVTLPVSMSVLLLAERLHVCVCVHPSVCLLQEFDRVPMFMKSVPDDIDPQKYPELASIQSIIHSEDRSPEGERKICRNTDRRNTSLC